MIRILVTATLAFACRDVHAQRFPDSVSSTTTFIRFNPLGLADLRDVNISFGAEKRITKKSSFAADASFIFYSFWMRDEVNSSKGFFFRPAYRFFPGKSNFFVEAELHYKQVTYRITDWVGRNAVNDVPSYEEFMTFSLRKTVIGGHIKAGRQFIVSDRFWLEVYTGIGPHFRKYKVTDEPGMRYTVNDTFFSVNTTETDALPAFPAGFRVLYRLSK